MAYLRKPTQPVHTPHRTCLALAVLAASLLISAAPSAAEAGERGLRQPTVISTGIAEPESLLTRLTPWILCPELSVSLSADQPLSCDKRAGAVTGVGIVCLTNESPPDPNALCEQRAQKSAGADCQVEVCKGGICSRDLCQVNIPNTGLVCKKGYDFEIRDVDDPNCKKILTCKRRCFCDCKCAP